MASAGLSFRKTLCALLLLCSTSTNALPHQQGPKVAIGDFPSTASLLASLSGSLVTVQTLKNNTDTTAALTTKVSIISNSSTFGWISTSAGAESASSEISNTICTAQVATQTTSTVPNTLASTEYAAKSTVWATVTSNAAPSSIFVTRTASSTQPSSNIAESMPVSLQESKLSLSTEFETISVSSSNGIDPFLPIATDAPPSQISSKGPHPVSTLGIQAPHDVPLHTNKFYANLYLGNQTNPVWTDPYSVSWSRGGGTSKSWGLAISHVEPNQRAFGPANTNISGGPASNMINPVGIQSLVFSASELGSDTVLTTDSLDTFSINLNLLPSTSSTSKITFPLLQGVSVITGLYTNLTPLIQSGIGIVSVNSATSPSNGIFKYQITTQDQKSWLLYATPVDGASDPRLTLMDGTLVGQTGAWSGSIQIGKNPNGNEGEKLYDAAAGIYVTGCNLTGSVTDAVGSYTLSWDVSGTGSAADLLMYALNHHLESFDNTTAAGIRNLTLATTTAGNATAVLGRSWTLTESALPTSMGFAPWTPNKGSVTSLSVAAVSAIQAVGGVDVGQDMNAQANVNSFYYAGKALFKFAQVVWVLQNLANSPQVAAAGLQKLKTVFDVFTSNKNQYPLVYDTTWKGVVSSAWNDSGADFGNSFYNDHHFHYGYFLGAAAAIGAMDKNWLDANKAYINTMARDVSNPSTEDPYFPRFRSFDWYRGHSWAKGLFDSGDGKDEESSSEDVMFAYGLKIWGNTVGDASMEARGNLMLAVLARSLQNYVLMSDDNVVQPENYIGNKAAGITFQNKLDHVTYFGTNLEYVEGIHMLPLVPASTLTRTIDFVQQEWNVYFAENATDPASKVVGGWKGVLYANLAIIDPSTSFKFFNVDNFDQGLLDGGASLTWYLAWAAGLGGA